MENQDQGRSAESENVMDQIQDEVQAGESDAMTVGRNQSGHGDNIDQAGAETLEREDQQRAQGVDVDPSVLDENYADIDQAPTQVEPDVVIYMPRKDFEASVNKDQYDFKKGVPVEVTRDIANMLEEDEERGYVRD